MHDFYLPALRKYAYHLPHVIIIGKKECGLQQKNTFENMVGSVKTRHDYAKRLPSTFNLEIQLEHFGNEQSLSIEGSTVETRETVDNNVKRCSCSFTHIF
jgi:hypothetical protein